MDDKCERHEFESLPHIGADRCKKCNRIVNRQFRFGYEEGFQHGHADMKRMKEAWDV